jgi:hypothetical protein
MRERWLELVRSRPGNEVVALDGTGHWVTADPRLKILLRSWLDGGAPYWLETVQHAAT